MEKWNIFPLYLYARTYTRGNSPNLGHFSRDLGQNLRVTFVIAPRFGQFSGIGKGDLWIFEKKDFAKIVKIWVKMKKISK